MNTAYLRKAAGFHGGRDLAGTLILKASNRTVSTTSAIKSGLRRSRDTPRSDATTRQHRPSRRSDDSPLTRDRPFNTRRYNDKPGETRDRKDFGKTRDRKDFGETRGRKDFGETRDRKDFQRGPRETYGSSAFSSKPRESRDRGDYQSRTRVIRDDSGYKGSKPRDMRSSNGSGFKDKPRDTQDGRGYSNTSDKTNYNSTSRTTFDKPGYLSRPREARDGKSYQSKPSNDRDYSDQKSKLRASDNNGYASKPRADQFSKSSKGQMELLATVRQKMMEKLNMGSTEESLSNDQRSPKIQRERKESVRDAKELDEDDDMPVSIPYSTASSQFLYGYNAVYAALRSKHRKLHHLHLQRRDANTESRNIDTLLSLAKNAGIKSSHNASTRLLDKMSEGRPHNGVVLEVSPIPAPPVLGLGRPNNGIPLHLGQQTTEDIMVNGAPQMLPVPSAGTRHPFVVMLDGITDPGNVGNILRSAYFYGVDAVAIATNTCANMSSAVLAKASSGACEAVPILALPKPSNFIYESAKNGWHICAAVAPDPSSLTGRKQATTADLAASSPLTERPCILMLGAEGEGLRENLRSRSDLDVSIQAGDRGVGIADVGIDSLNVSAAAGVLMESFLRKPANKGADVGTAEREGLGF